MEPPDLDQNQKTEEQRQEDMRLMRQTLNSKTGPYNLFPRYASRSKTTSLCYLLAVLPAYLVSLILPYRRYHYTALIVGVGVYLLAATLLNIRITAWVRKKPQSSKWYYFLD